MSQHHAASVYLVVCVLALGVYVNVNQVLVCVSFCFLFTERLLSFYDYSLEVDYSPEVENNQLQPSLQFPVWYVLQYQWELSIPTDIQLYINFHYMGVLHYYKTS